MNEQSQKEQEKEKEDRKCEENEHEESENCEKMTEEEEKKLKVEEERKEEEEAERCKVKLVSAPVAHTHGETIQVSGLLLDRVKQEIDPEVRCLSFSTGVSYSTATMHVKCVFD